MNQQSNPGQAGAGVLSERNPNYLLTWSLHPGSRAVLFLLPVIVLCAWLAYEGIRVAWATSKLDVFSIPEIKHAIRLDPDNPDLLHWLGLVYTSVPTEINPAESVKYIREAARLNPGRWEYWSDLGTSCDFLGDTPCADDAFHRAEMLNPMTPAVQWAVGNHYLLTNREEMAFPYFRKLLEKDLDYLDPTFRLCMRAVRDPQAIYEGAIPQGKNSSARFAFLVFLTSSGNYDDAMRIWGKMISGPDRTPNLDSVKPFLEFLIDHNKIQDARTVWDDLAHTGAIPPSPVQNGANLLYDPGLALPPLNTGFAWHMNESPELQFDSSETCVHEGSKCLRINFAVGRNADYDLLEQVVVVKPKTRYQLVAAVRSDNLTSDSGPRLRVVEMGCTACPIRVSDATLGTTAWHPVDVAFETQEQTQAVRISFWRPQGQTSLGDITGTVWVDNLLLRTVDATEPGANPARGK